MTEHPPSDVARLMAGIVDNRMRMWLLLQEVVSRPDVAVAQRLNSGAWVGDVREAVQWLGETAERFRPGLDAVTSSVETSPVTPEGLMASYDAIVAGRATMLSDVISDLMGQLQAESRSWATGDEEHAKTLRLAQHDQLHRRMVPAVQQWCYAALNQQAPVFPALVKVAAVVLSMETGRDFTRGMDGRDFHITNDIA